MRVIYLAAPLSAPTPEGVAANLTRAKRWVAWAYGEGVAPVAPWITCCEVLDDSDPEMRQRGLACDFATIERMDELWLVGGRVSNGMLLESEWARKHGIEVRDMTFLGDEPPG